MPAAEDGQCHAFLREFADSLTRSFSSPVAAHAEEQLKMPVQLLLQSIGPAMNLEADTKPESPVEDIGRPDIAVEVDRLLCGFVELKAPGTGANVTRFRGHNRQQWKKFSDLPNLVYTDGNEWSLYRKGERIGTRIVFSGDVTRDGAGAVTEEDAEQLSRLLRDFFSWQPIVPTNPQGLAELLAPLCHLLRDDVMRALENPDSNLSTLARQWRELLFPDADDAQFADAYAQTFTYALLLARLGGQENLATNAAADALQGGHRLLAQALRVLGDPQAREEISTGVALLERSITAVNPKELAEEDADPWLYFYEDFLAAYDSDLRKDRGVYYTPVEVVQTQVNLVSELLVNRFGKTRSFADEGVVLLDPAVGTGTYPLAALQHGFDLVADRYGPGRVGATASEMAKNVHAFELLVGPYAVAHLRLSERIIDAGGTLPEDGVHVYLTDTLESPHATPPGRFTLFERELAMEHRRALKVKSDVPVLVCIGNPPYDRQQIAPEDETTIRKGGWVRYGDSGDGSDAILRNFLEPAREAGHGVHLKNLYNDYVYFWRWALWKVFESKNPPGPGVLSFITASSYLRGPAFVGMREVMRRTFDDLWIIDLEGDNLGARRTENVFNIQTPVAIAVGVRYGDPNLNEPARVHYTKIEGSRDEKLAALNRVQNFNDLSWKGCFTGWQNPLLPEGEGDYFSWPLITDLELAPIGHGLREGRPSQR